MTVYVIRDGVLVEKGSAPPRPGGPYVIPDVAEHESPMGDGTWITSRSQVREVCARHNLRVKDPGEGLGGKVKSERIARKYGVPWIGD